MSGGAALARFHREVRVARQVPRKNVCRVYDIGEIDGRHFLSMEFIKREELSSLLRRIGRLPQDKAIQIARQICAGLAAAHDAGVLHRDLKPANIMIDGDGNARVLDFGLAGLVEEFGDEEKKAGIRAWQGSPCLVGSYCWIEAEITFPARWWVDVASYRLPRTEPLIFLRVVSPVCKTGIAVSTSE